MTNEPQALLSALGELNAGVYMAQIDEVLKEVAKAVINHGDKGKKGKVVLTLTLARMGEDTDMVNIEHSWQYEQPEMRGKSTRINTSNTPMCVNRGGELSIYPLTQTDVFEAKPVTPIREVK